MTDYDERDERDQENELNQTAHTSEASSMTSDAETAQNQTQTTVQHQAQTTTQQQTAQAQPQNGTYRMQGSQVTQDQTNTWSAGQTAGQPTSGSQPTQSGPYATGSGQFHSQYGGRYQYEKGFSTNYNQNAQTGSNQYGQSNQAGQYGQTQNSQYGRYNQYGNYNYQYGQGSQNGQSSQYGQASQYGQNNQYSTQYSTDSRTINRTDTTGSDKNKKSKKSSEKSGIGAKGIVAIILSCALVFSCIGFGSAVVLGKTIAANQTTTSQEASNSSDSSNHSSSNNSAETAESENSTGTDFSLTVAEAEEDALTTPEIVAKAQDSVVEIVTEEVVTGSMMQQYISSGAGSGVIITSDGYILTNNHVIDGAETITVTLHNGDSYDATLVGTDDQLDIALLKIEATDLTPATIGSSSDLVVGQTVVAIGNPLGQLGGTVTQGIISALDRSITIDGVTMNLMQIDASINPGNSGGGLFDAQGNLIGIVNAKSTGDDVEGIGFAIPIDDALSIIDDLKEYGYVRGRALIGISMLDITSEEMAWMYRVNYTGCYIYSVTEGTAADEAGLQSGDLIVSVNGTEVSTSTEVKKVLEDLSVGDEVTFVVLRNSRQITVTVTAGEYNPTITSGSTAENASTSSTTDLTTL